MKKIIIIIFSIIILLSFFLLEKNKNHKEYIDFSDTIDTVKKEDTETVSIGMISVSGDNKGYVAEKNLANYIAKKLNKNVKFIQRKSYKEINTLLKNKEIDIAFLSVGAYVLYDDKKNLSLIAKPCRGKSFYHPVVIAKKNSSIDNIEDLKNKDFAFVDTYSYSGYIFLSNYLEEKGTNVDEFFNKKYYFTYSHEQSVRQVANENVEAGVVDDWVLQYLEKNDPELLSEIKIVKIFDEVSTGPIVTHKNYEQKDQLKEILFNINKDETISETLDKLQITSYEETTKENYPILRGEEDAS